jgi:probable HAF family extracellular repeat protein
MQNLNDLIDPASGWVLREATGINERGQIVGWAELNGHEHAFRLTPQLVVHRD